MKTLARIASNELLNVRDDQLLPESELVLTLVERDYKPTPGRDNPGYAYQTIRFAMNQEVIKGLIQTLTAIGDELDTLERRVEPIQVKPRQEEPTSAPPKPASAKDWTEDAGHENGQYQNQCMTCAAIFIGHKRRGVCKECATQPPGD